MKMTDEIRIKAPRDEVFAALNNPEILRQAIPGCQDLKQTSKTELTGTVQAKVGPVKATFQGTVTRSDIIAPEGYTITGEGKGGAAGFAKACENHAHATFHFSNHAQGDKAFLALSQII